MCNKKTRLIKMTRLEQIDFDSKEKFKEAIDMILDGKEAIRDWSDKDGKVQRKKIISKNKLYLGNFALQITEATNGKCYLSISYFSFDDRMEIAKINNTNSI